MHPNKTRRSSRSATREVEVYEHHGGGVHAHGRHPGPQDPEDGDLALLFRLVFFFFLRGVERAVAGVFGLFCSMFCVCFLGGDQLQLFALVGFGEASVLDMVDV